MTKYNRKITKILWHDWQVKLIAENAGIKPVQEIARLTKRTIIAVKKKANLHGYSLVHPDNEV